MKESFYNFYLPQEEIILLYNSFSNAYLALNKTLFDDITFGEYIDIDKLKDKYKKIFQQLCDNGFIINDDIDEKTLCENLFYRRRFSQKCYELTINPTLDCNLRCWYCYENHLEKSNPSNEFTRDIIRHLKYKCEVEPFEILKLNFFGGEPMLKTQIVKEIISKTKELAAKFNFKLYIHFTTNGTITLKTTLLNELKDCFVSFQITLDGNEKTHNAIRIWKTPGNSKGTYHIILNNIKHICNELDNCLVNVRINFSNETFIELESLIDDLDFCNRKKVFLSLHKIWQLNNDSIDKSNLFEFISYARSKRFVVHYMMLNNYSGSACYADNYNQAVINYDGKVFKCTAREFNDKNCEGILTREGIIDWKTDKLMNRMNVRIAENCKKCKLLPSCPGICSQKKLENKEETMCALDDDFTMQDYIIHNFNNKILEAKIKESL